MPIRRKCFISYHHADQAWVDYFENTFDHTHDVFIARRLGSMPDDLIRSSDTSYVMSKIRTDYIQDSTVTIVLLGAHTWGRRYVDWEIQSSLRSGETAIPNGLLGIKLPSFGGFPPRMSANLLAPGALPDSNYAGHIPFPENLDVLANAIEWAFQRRITHRNRIINIRDRMMQNMAGGV